MGARRAGCLRRRGIVSSCIVSSCIVLYCIVLSCIVCSFLSAFFAFLSAFFSFRCTFCTLNAFSVCIHVLPSAPALRRTGHIQSRTTRFIFIMQPSSTAYINSAYTSTACTLPYKFLQKFTESLHLTDNWRIEYEYFVNFQRNLYPNVQVPPCFPLYMKGV